MKPNNGKISKQAITQQYRERLHEIQTQLHQYRGTSMEFESLIDLMHDLEQWMLQVFGEKGWRRLSTETESAISQEYLNETDNTISDLLEKMNRRYEEWIKKCLAQPESGNILIENNIDVLLPPQQPPVIIAGKGENRFEEARYDERLLKLLLLLNSEGIFTNDLIIVRGVVTSDMMRTEAYVLVEIPCIERQVLICNEVGEATFVIRGILDRSTYVELDKEELQLRYPQKVRRVVYYNQEHWNETVKKYLFEDITSFEKVDMRFLEDIKKAVRQIVPTAKEWSELSIRQLKKLRFNGMGFGALATKLGIKGSRNRKLQLSIGRKVYGEHELLKEWTAAEIRAEVKSLLPTAEEWINIPTKKRSHFRVHGIGLMTLTAMLGEHFNPFEKNSDYLKLGRMVYGEEKVLQDDKYLPENLISAIKELIPTAEEWIKSPVRKIVKISINDMGMGKIASRLGLGQKRKLNSKLFIELGRIIYGDDPVFDLDEVTLKAYRLAGRKECQLSEDEKQILDKLGLRIREQITTAEEWAALNPEKRGKIKVLGLGLQAIASRFGVKGKPVSRTSDHFALGRAIYGEHEVFNEKNILEQLQEAILEQYPTPEDWINVKISQRKKMKILGLGLVALSTRFGIKGDPAQSRTLYLELGQKIYGECDILKNWKRNEICLEIIKDIPTYEAWMQLKQEEKLTFMGCGMKMNRLARYLGIKKGDPIAKKEVLAELGKIIYGIDESGAEGRN